MAEKRFPRFSFAYLWLLTFYFIVSGIIVLILNIFCCPTGLGYFLLPGLGFGIFPIYLIGQIGITGPDKSYIPKELAEVMPYVLSISAIVLSILAVYFLYIIKKEKKLAGIYFFYGLVILQTIFSWSNIITYFKHQSDFVGILFVIGSIIFPTLLFIATRNLHKWLKDDYTEKPMDAP